MTTRADDPRPRVLPIAELLDRDRPAPDPDALETLGASREGRPIRGLRIGRGPRAVSLIAGCHADEPIGPAVLDRLAAHLLALDDESPLRQRFSWSIVPHVNPDGEARNAAWRDLLGDPRGWTTPERRVDLAAYLRHVRREPPGEDVEFGFPRDADDDLPRGADENEARPENRAVADFLRAGVDAHGPYALHGSLHGMGFAAGPWFLLEASWVDRTADLRARLRRAVHDLGYVVHDVDRRGEKGFHRIGEGFTTRPDSRAMASHFRALGDDATARLFRPSSMEFVRSLAVGSSNDDPLTFVTEMPLFLVPRDQYATDPLRPPALTALRAARDDAEIDRRADELGIVGMPIRDQMHLQLLYIDACLAAIERSSAEA